MEQGERKDSPFLAPFAVWCCCIDESERMQDMVSVNLASTSSNNASGMALCQAATDGDHITVAALLQLRANVNCPKSGDSGCFNATPLILASRMGHEKVVSLLMADPHLDMNATSEDVKRSGRSKQTALTWASRRGHVGIVRMLLKNQQTNVNAITAARFSPLMVAAQQGHAEVVQALIADSRTDVQYSFEFDGKETMSPMTIAILEGQSAVVKALASDPRIDLNRLHKFSYGQDTLLGNSVHLHRTRVAEVLLNAKADPNIPSSEGITPLLHGLESGNLEVMALLLLHNVDCSDHFSELRMGQIVGDVAEVRRIIYEDPTIIHALNENIPNLHVNSIFDDCESLQKEIMHLNQQGPGVNTLDGGCMSAVLYALELGHDEAALLLLRDYHHIPDDVVEGMLVKAKQGPAKDVGENAWEAMKVFLSTAPVQVVPQGYVELIMPYIGSLLALRFFYAREEEFKTLRHLASRMAFSIQQGIDEEVGEEALRQLYATMPPTIEEASLRQDDPGLIPRLEYVWNEATGSLIGGDHEFYIAMSYSLLGEGLRLTFEVDMKETFSELTDEILFASPKGYMRMYNKLNDPYDLGGMDIRAPRSAKNLDLLRLTVVLPDIDTFAMAFDALQSRYEILHVENHYKAGKTNINRHVRVNFAFRPSVTFAEIFGTGIYDAAAFEHAPHNDAARIWLCYCRSMPASSAWSWALQGWWRAALLQPHRPVALVAEVLFVYKSYASGCELAQLLHKVSQCEMGPLQMVRDFSPGFEKRRLETERLRRVATAIAGSVRKMKLL